MSKTINGLKPVVD